MCRDEAGRLRKGFGLDVVVVEGELGAKYMMDGERARFDLPQFFHILMTYILTEGKSHKSVTT